MSVKPVPNDPKLRHGTDKCRCMACGEYFNSSYGFDEHRVGPWSRSGADRRCLTIEEMRERGWALSATGHWIKETRQKRQDRAGALQPPADLVDPVA